jgi:heavy metal translocating P-type ATPase
MKKTINIDRLLRRSLVTIAIAGLAIGAAARVAGYSSLAGQCWFAATVPVIAGLGYSIVQDLANGRVGVDAVALVSMVGALALAQPLAGAVIALMYSGGNVLEDFAIGRAERDLRSLVDRAPRVAHRRLDHRIEDVAVADVAVGDTILVHGGEVIPVDGVITSPSAVIDESALTGEPLPAAKAPGTSVFSGTLNAGEAFELVASSVAGASTYAGIVRLVTAAQTAKAPFVRLADQFAVVLLPVTIVIAVIAWLISGDLVRSLAVFVAATPCPLILAAPVAFIAGVAQAARRGILVKGGAPLEALARTHTVLFDKTGTLTVGGARLLWIESAPGEQADRVLQLSAALEQASHHVLASAVVGAALDRGLPLPMPRDVRETVGSGICGVIDGMSVSAGSRDLIYGHRQPEEWALRVIRRAAWRSALVVFVAVEGRTVGALLLADDLRTETPRAIRMLRAARVARIVMVTGDHAASAQTIGAALDLDAVLADRVPSDKVDAVRTEQRLYPTTMVGDGINDAPALAAANVGIAMGARGASASSEAADVVIIADRLDRVAEALVIAQRARRIAMESIIAGMGLSGFAMIAAMLGWIEPVPAALIQEMIDVAVILNALRALRPARQHRAPALSAATGRQLHRDHVSLGRSLDRLRAIADMLDYVTPESAINLIEEANSVVEQQVVTHERNDEGKVYPALARVLTGDRPGLSAMSRAHREILHLARLLARLAEDVSSQTIDRYLVRDAQRAIESIEILVRMHVAQEEEIYEAAQAQ